jgi:hypothetical protein
MLGEAMTIESLAAKYKLKTKKLDSTDEVVIPGRLGHIFIYSDDTVGAIFMPPEVSKGWLRRRETFVKAGATVTQNGDTEGVVAFPIGRVDLVKLAVKLLGCRGKKKISPEHLAKLQESRKKALATRGKSKANSSRKSKSKG